MTVSLQLREPTQLASTKALSYWRVRIVPAALLLWIAALSVAGASVAETGWWTPFLWAAAALTALAPILWLILVPRLRYRIHRWEVTDTAIHVRYGWLSVTDQIVPLSRVQTVDSYQGPVMRQFALRSVTVRTASAAGHVQIACLDDPTARDVVARLVTITGRTAGDAT